MSALLRESKWVCVMSPLTLSDNCVKVEAGPNSVSVLSEVSAI